MTMLTKLKYAGVSIEDLLEIYSLFIRSTAEYCAVAFHPSLTVAQATDIERIQKVSLKIILADNYIDYGAALEMTGLQTLHNRREKPCLDFAKKCLKHPRHKKLFPTNSTLKDSTNIRNREPFTVNFARTERYKKSSIPYCQRLLNKNFK